MEKAVQSFSNQQRDAAKAPINEKRSLSILKTAVGKVFSQKESVMNVHALKPRNCQPDTKVTRRKAEILSYSSELQQYGISIEDITTNAPRKNAVISQAIEVARLLASDKKLKEEFFDIKDVPVRSLLDQKRGVSKRFVLKNKMYITGITLLLIGNYTELQDYVTRGALH